MPKSSWPASLPAAGYESFCSTFKLITEVMPQVRGTMASQSLRQYMDLSLRRAAYDRLSPRGRSTKLRDDDARKADLRRRIAVVRKQLPKRRDRTDPLITLLREWGRTELTPVAYEEWKYRRKVIFRQAVTDIPKLRHRLRGAIREFVALAHYGYSVGELVYLARIGDDRSLFDLISLEKTFLFASFAQKRIRVAASYEDQRFFGGLAKALERDTYREHNPSVRRAIAVYLAWFLGFENLPRKELKDFLVAEGLDTYGTAGIDMLLTRLALSKPRAARLNQRTNKNRPKTR